MIILNLSAIEYHGWGSGGVPVAGSVPHVTPCRFTPEINLFDCIWTIAVILQVFEFFRAMRLAQLLCFGAALDIAILGRCGLRQQWFQVLRCIDALIRPIETIGDVLTYIVPACVWRVVTS